MNKCMYVIGGVVLLVALLVGRLYLQPCNMSTSTLSDGRVRFESFGACYPLPFSAINEILRPFAAYAFPLTVDSMLAKFPELDSTTEDYKQMKEGLAVILETLRENNPNIFTPFGRLAAHGYLQDQVAGFLFMQKALKQYPEIEDEVLESPVIIPSMARTGTTLLHRALSATNKFRVLKQYELQYPIHPNGSFPLTEEHKKQAYAKCEQSLSAYQEILPWFSVVHPTSCDMEEEELILETTTGHSLFYSTLLQSAPYLDWLFSKDGRFGLEGVKLGLKIIQHQDRIDSGLGKDYKPKPYLLKSPVHASRLKVLKELFPDATVILTHRDPVVSSISGMHLAAMLGSVFYEQVDLDNTAALMHKIDQASLRSQIYDMKAFGDKVMHVKSSELFADNWGVIKQVLEFVGVQVTENVERAVKDLLKASPREGSVKLAYDKATFNTSTAKMEEVMGKELVQKYREMYL
eukprot:m.96782 g.96782  ORF g.96782 m.96782 type:complete len:463 (-) comp22001_c1_seq1:31-1419(-)